MEVQDKNKGKKKWSHAEKRSKYFKDVIAQQPENKNWMEHRVKKSQSQKKKSNPADKTRPFVNKRDKYIMMQYKKNFKNNKGSAKEPENNESTSTAFNQNKKNRFKKSQFNSAQEEKRKRDDERNQAEAERKRKVEKRKIERAERIKIINQKTSKGQPLMKGRIQLLLKKIQNSL